MSDGRKLLVDADAAKLCRDLAQFVAATRGSMLADEAKAWAAIHALTPVAEGGEAAPYDDKDLHHVWQPPCGTDEGTDSCWLCGHPRASHPTVADALVQERDALRAENERLRAALRGLMGYSPDHPRDLHDGDECGCSECVAWRMAEKALGLEETR